MGSEVKNIGTISRIYMLKACIKHNVIIKQIYGLYNCFSLFSLLLFLPCFCKLFLIQRGGGGPIPQSGHEKCLQR